MELSPALLGISGEFSFDSQSPTTAIERFVQAKQQIDQSNALLREVEGLAIEEALSIHANNLDAGSYSHVVYRSKVAQVVLQFRSEKPNPNHYPAFADAIERMDSALAARRLAVGGRTKAYLPRLRELEAEKERIEQEIAWINQEIRAIELEDEYVRDTCEEVEEIRQQIEQSKKPVLVVKLL